MSILGFGLWASSGPFPLSAHYGLYKRGRDPPTNPSRHLRKKDSSSQVAAQGRLGKESNRRRRRRRRTDRAATPRRATSTTSDFHATPRRATSTPPDVDREDLTLSIIASFPGSPAVDSADRHACLHVGLGWRSLT